VGPFVNGRRSRPSSIKQALHTHADTEAVDHVFVSIFTIYIYNREGDDFQSRAEFIWSNYLRVFDGRRSYEFLHYDLRAPSIKSAGLNSIDVEYLWRRLPPLFSLLESQCLYAGKIFDVLLL
jgi:hypothetical protein